MKDSLSSSLFPAMESVEEALSFIVPQLPTASRNQLVGFIAIIKNTVQKERTCHSS